MSSLKTNYKLLVIDPHVSLDSPSMRGWIREIEAFAYIFDSIEIWSVTCSIVDHPKVKWVKFKSYPTWIIQSRTFYHEVGKRVKSNRVWPPTNTLVQATGNYSVWAHVRYIHFSNILLMEEQKKRPEYLKFSLFRKMVINNSCRSEKNIYKNNSYNPSWWVVSRNLGEEIYNLAGKQGDLHILPNTYDTSQFNTEIRCLYRNEMREKLGLKTNEIVFVFSAYAHFERKGLLHAVEAIEIARKKNYPFRLIVIGGKNKTVRRFTNLLDKRGISYEGVKFVGLVNNVNQYLASAEAFLFPSHFEAFSLAEIEAAAMGLRLYLTNHYGAEMILREPTNGQYIEWGAGEIASTLIDDYESGLLGSYHSDLGEAVTPTQFGKCLRTLYHKAISKI